MNAEKYAEEIAYQWRKTWSEKKLQDLVAHCENDSVALRYFLKYLPKQGKILECGCGLGQWVVYLSQKGYDMAGVEIVPECIEVCKKFYPSTEIHVGDVRQLPFPDQSFSGYISIGVVEHMIEGPETTLLELKRIIGSGGIAILTVPAFNYFLRAWYPFRRWMVDLVRYNSFIREILGKPALNGDIQKNREQLQSLRSQLRSDFWPIVKVDADKGPLFIEYKCKSGQIDGMLRSLGFNILEAVPVAHPFVMRDVFGDFLFKDHSPDSAELNWVGQIIYKVFTMINPEFFNYVYLYVARKA